MQFFSLETHFPISNRDQGDSGECPVRVPVPCTPYLPGCTYLGPGDGYGGRYGVRARVPRHGRERV